MHKYPISAMCDVLQIPRSTYILLSKERKNNDAEIVKLVVQIFKNSRNIYGQIKIKKELEKRGWTVSCRRMGQIMKDQGLVSKYTALQL